MNSNDYGGGDHAPPLHDESQTQLSVPLGAGEFNDESSGLDVLAGSESTTKIPTGSLVLILVVVAAIGGLFCMRTLARVTAAASGDSEIEKIITGFFERAGGENSNATLSNAPDAIIAVLEEAYTEHQVPLSNVQRNPFIIHGFDVMPTNDGGGGGKDPVQVRVSEFQQQRDQRESQLINTAFSFKVKSILMGSSPLANVDGRIVRVGDVLVALDGKTEYEITRVTDGAVHLVATDERFDLRVEHVLRMDIAQ